jgi:hypothetical protein
MVSQRRPHSLGYKRTLSFFSPLTLGTTDAGRAASTLVRTERDRGSELSRRRKYYRCEQLLQLGFALSRTNASEFLRGTGLLNHYYAEHVAA